MQGYFDSSVLLSILLEQEGKKQAEKIWSQINGKTSSLLLNAEIRIVLRRYHANARSHEEQLELLRKESKAEEIIQAVEFVPFTSEVMDLIRREKGLSKCRTLDAIHLATALFLQRETGEPLVVCSYDSRMRETARELGFTVLPK